MSIGNVYFKNKASGKIEKKIDGSFEFKYQNDGQSVSWTLPNSHQTYHSSHLFPFFDGLIPEGWLLNLLEKNWKIQRNDRMALLLSTGLDCIGAVHISDENQDHSDISGVQKFVQPRQHDFHSTQCLVCMEVLSMGVDTYHQKCAKKTFGFSHSPFIDISMDDIENLALLQINQRMTLTGVQKKLSLGSVIENKKERLTVVGLDGRFILKPSSDEYPEMAENEHLCMKLAELHEIPVAQCGLIYLASGEKAYITKRFDRQDGEKIQVEDFCQLSEKSTAQKYTGSSEAMGEIIDKYSEQPQDDKLTLFQILLFSFLIGNADMHLKNFSLWRDPRGGRIRMSPGYDFLNTRLLIPSSEDSEELALPLNGRKNKIKWSDFLALGENLKLNKKILENARDKMLDLFFESENLIEKSFLSANLKSSFLELLSERSKRISNS
jgi:serine/threonine-protein kinase HipA